MGIFGHIFFWWHHTLFLIEKRWINWKSWGKKVFMTSMMISFCFLMLFFLSKILIDVMLPLLLGRLIGRPWKLMKIDARQDEFPSLGWYLSVDMLIFGWVIAINCFCDYFVLIGEIRKCLMPDFAIVDIMDEYFEYITWYTYMAYLTESMNGNSK